MPAPTTAIPLPSGKVAIDQHLTTSHSFHRVYGSPSANELWWQHHREHDVEGDGVPPPDHVHDWDDWHPGTTR